MQTIRPVGSFGNVRPLAEVPIRVDFAEDKPLAACLMLIEVCAWCLLVETLVCWKGTGLAKTGLCQRRSAPACLELAASLKGFHPRQRP